MDEVFFNKERMSCLANAVARVLIASYFIAVALGVVIDPNGFIKDEVLAAMPDFLRYPNRAFELLAAFSILIGFQTRMAVALLALYVFWSSFIFNYVPSNPLAMGAFWRDLSSIGALLLLFAHGTGRFSVDYLFTRRVYLDEEDTYEDGDEAAQIDRPQSNSTPEAPVVINA